MGQHITIVTEDEKNEFAIGSSVIEFRRVDTLTYDNIARKHRTKKGTDRTGRTIHEENTQEINNDVLDYAIIGWRDVRHPITGEAVPCTRENKLKLPSQVKADLIEKCMEATTEFEEKKT